MNKGKIQRLTAEGRMTEAGFTCIKKARQNGSWTILDKIEKLTIPKDLNAAFKNYRGSKVFFTGLSPSVRKMPLQWVVLAKRPETRHNRIHQIAELAAQKLKPKQFS